MGFIFSENKSAKLMIQMGAIVTSINNISNGQTVVNKAINDESGNNIKDNYGASFSVSNNLIVLVNKNGTAIDSITVPYATKASQDEDGNNIKQTYAPLGSPIFTGSPTTPDVSSGDSSDRIANTRFVVNAINSAVSGITKVQFNVVEELPATGTDEYIYLVPISTDPEADNVYYEYIWVNNKFEKIGSTAIDLSKYFNSYEVTGSGNAITGVSASNNKLSFSKDVTYLTASDKIASATNADTATYSVTAGTANAVDWSNVSNKPTSIAKATNADTATYASSAGAVAWGNISGKPDTYSPSSHTHSTSEISNFSSSVAAIKVSNATNADTATYATSAGSAGSASSADSATNASTAEYAKSGPFAATSHGNHVPATQSANNAVFLRNDNTWQTVTPANIGAAESSHTHNYAGSSSAGGNATRAVTAGNSATDNTVVDNTLWDFGLLS